MTQSSTYLALKKAFDEFDTDHDNAISLTEVKAIFNKHNLLNQLTDAQIDKMVNAVDTNNNGKIEWTEFYDYMCPIVEKKENIETIKASFKEFDLDGDGFVDAMELKKKLSELQGQSIPMEEIKQIIDSVDVNGDGKIDINEFIELMQED